MLAPNAVARLYDLRMLIRREFMTGQTTDFGDDELGWMLGQGDRPLS